MGDMSILEMLFVGCAILGGGLFFIRVVLMFMGGESEADGDVDVAGDVDADVDADADVGADAGGSDTSFKILSLQGLTGFFMMFGLIGLAVLRAISPGAVGDIVSILAAVGAGLFAVWVITKLFSLMKGLQSSGTLDLASAAGKEGSVYLRIPAEGRGKVQITIQGRLQEFEAVSEKKVDIKTAEHIRVVRVVSGNVMSVEKA